MHLDTIFDISVPTSLWAVSPPEYIYRSTHPAPGHLISPGPSVSSLILFLFLSMFVYVCTYILHHTHTDAEMSIFFSTFRVHVGEAKENMFFPLSHLLPSPQRPARSSTWGHLTSRRRATGTTCRAAPSTQGAGCLASPTTPPTNRTASISASRAARRPTRPSTTSTATERRTSCASSSSLRNSGHPVGSLVLLATSFCQLL